MLTFQVQSIFKPLRGKQPSSSFLPTAKPARPSRPRHLFDLNFVINFVLKTILYVIPHDRQGSGRQGGRRRLRFRPSSAQRPQEPSPTSQPVTEAFQVVFGHLLHMIIVWSRCWTRCPSNQKVWGRHLASTHRRAPSRVSAHSRALKKVSAQRVRGVLGRSRQGETSRQSSVNSGLARPSPRSNLWEGSLLLAGAASTLNQAASRQTRKLSTNRDLNRIKLLNNLRGSDSHKDLNKIKDLSWLKYLNNQQQQHSHKTLNNQEQLHNHKDLNNQEPACSLSDLNSREQPRLKTLHKTRYFPLSSRRGLCKDLHPSCRTAKVCKGLNRGGRTTWTNLNRTNWISQAVQIWPPPQIWGKTASNLSSQWGKAAFSRLLPKYSLILRQSLQSLLKIIDGSFCTNFVQILAPFTEMWY